MTRKAKPVIAKRAGRRWTRTWMPQAFRLRNIDQVKSFLGETPAVSHRIGCLHAMTMKLRKRLVFGEDPTYPETLVKEMRKAELMRIANLSRKPWYTEMLLELSGEESSIDCQAKPDIRYGADVQLLHRPDMDESARFRKEHALETGAGVLAFAISHRSTHARAMAMWALNKKRRCRIVNGTMKLMPRSMMREMACAYLLSKFVTRYTRNNATNIGPLSAYLRMMPEQLRARLLFGADPTVPGFLLRLIRAADLERIQKKDYRPSYYAELLSYSLVDKATAKPGGNDGPMDDEAKPIASVKQKPDESCVGGSTEMSTDDGHTVGGNGEAMQVIDDQLTIDPEVMQMIMDL